MKELTEKQKAKLLATAEIVDKGELAILSKLYEFDEALEENTEKVNEAISMATTTVNNLETEVSQKIDAKLAELKDGERGEDGKDYVLTEKDKQEIAEMIVPPMFETPEKVIERIVVEQPIVTEVSKITNEIKEVAKYETPEQIVDKVNVSKTKISRDQVDGLRDIENIAKANQMPITTTFVNGKRAKNITFNNAVVAGDLANISIPVQPTAPENPTLNMLWIDSSA